MPSIVSPIPLARACPIDLATPTNLLDGRGRLDADRMAEHIARTLEAAGASYGYGGYGEVRRVYTSPAFAEETPTGIRYRTVHLGLDVWAPAGTRVRAPLPARIHSVGIDAAPLTYGPVVILQHNSPIGPTFYTLYGHLSTEDVVAYRSQLANGRSVAFAAGDTVGTVGGRHENGGWPPHLHFQVIQDLQGMHGDYPGVAFPERAQEMLANCPNPYPFFPDLPTGAQPNVSRTGFSE